MLLIIIRQSYGGNDRFAVANGRNNDVFCDIILEHKTEGNEHRERAYRNLLRESRAGESGSSDFFVGESEKPTLESLKDSKMSPSEDIKKYDNMDFDDDEGACSDDSDIEFWQKQPIVHRK